MFYLVAGIFYYRIGIIFIFFFELYASSQLNALPPIHMFLVLLYYVYFEHCQERRRLKYALSRSKCSQLSVSHGWLIWLPLTKHCKHREASWSLAKLISSVVDMALLFPDWSWISLYHAFRNRRDLLTPSNADPDRPGLALHRSVRFLPLDWIPQLFILKRFITVALMQLSCFLTWAVTMSYGTQAVGDLFLVFY